MEIWDDVLQGMDRKVYEVSGYGKRAGYGKRPAILVIDVNYAFVGQERLPVLESIQKWRMSCGESGWDALEKIKVLLDASRAKNLPIFYSTGIDRRPDGFDAGGWRRKNDRSAEDTARPKTPDFHGNDIVTLIEPTSRDILIRKIKPSAFFGTPLVGFLVDLGVDTIIAVGTTTSGCVRATVIDGFSHNFNMVVIGECTFDRFDISHKVSLFDMNAKYADVVPLEDTLRYIGTLPADLYDDKLPPLKDK